MRLHLDYPTSQVFVTLSNGSLSLSELSSSLTSIASLVKNVAVNKVVFPVFQQKVEDILERYNSVRVRLSKRDGFVMLCPALMDTSEEEINGSDILFLLLIISPLEHITQMRVMSLGLG